MENELILNAVGWTVECESPFEIRHEDGSFASGQAAYIVYDSILEENNVIKFNELALGARFSYLGSTNAVWIKLSDEGCGLVAKYDSDYISKPNWTGQQICSFADTVEELKTLDVLLRE